MASEESIAGRPVYVRFLLLLVAEAIAGLALYVTFAFMPRAVQGVIVLASFVIVQIDIIFYPKKNKSLASSLCGITAIFVVSSGVAWRITHEEFLSRLMLVGSCLMAALIFLDRRQEWLDFD